MTGSSGLNSPAAKPRQSLAGLCNISLGFFGIQVAFGLQNANVSRIFQALGADVDNLAFLWIAGPVTGLLVQPLVGHFSDRTWGPLGRRRPYFLAGAVLAALALVILPAAPMLLLAALSLWLLDASLNISMEPFRAFVGDMVGPDQQAAGYAVQTGFIGAGAVLGSLAPKLMTLAGVSSVADHGAVPDSVRLSFIIGAVAILAAVLWTVVTTREYPPEAMAAFSETADSTDLPPAPPRHGLWWLSGGAALVAAVWRLALDKQLYVLGGALAAFGLVQIVVGVRRRAGARPGAVSQVLSALAAMPGPMRRLALTQVFTWLGLFVLWIYTTPVVTRYVFHALDPKSRAYNDGADHVGVMFSVYNAVATLAAFVLPTLVKRLGAAKAHGLCLGVGACSFLGLFLFRDANLLFLPMIGIGLTWASVLTLPYVMLSRTLPANRLGTYMGLFNIFIVLPQLIVATAMGAMMKLLFPGDPIWTMLVGAVVMGLAALLALRVGADAGPA